MVRRLRSTGTKKVAVVGLVAVLALLAGLVAGPASAQSVEIPLTDVVITGDPGSSAVIGTADVAADLVGRSCDVSIEVKNQSSVHPGNKLVVSSGDSSVEVAGIEDTADGVTMQAGTLTLGATVQASVVLGDDGITSLGSSLTVTCKPLPVTPPTPPVKADPPYTG